MSSNEDKYGQKIEYDPLWKGPMQNIRFTTDRIWLIVFALYMVIFISGGIYSFSAGNISRNFVPNDYKGRACGIDAEVIDKPYVLLLNLKKCLGSGNCEDVPSVCLSKCPTENFIYNQSGQSVDQVKSKLICTSDVNTNLIKNFDQIDELIRLEKCAKWYLDSESIFNYCLARSTWSGHEEETISFDDLSKVRNTIKELQSFWKQLKKDTGTAIKPAIIAIVCGGIIAFAYVVLLKWFAVPFFYASMAMFLSIMVYGIYKLSVMYAKEKQESYLYLLILLIIMSVLLIIAIIFFRKKIYMACLLVKESSKAVVHLSTTLIFPILPYLLYVLVIVFSAVVLGSLMSIKKSNYRIQISNTTIENCSCETQSIGLIGDVECDPATFNAKCKTSTGDLCLFTQCELDNMTSPSYLFIFHSINFVGFYWLIFFISGFEYMVLGGTFASWYWTFNKNNIGNYSLIESTSRTLRYHLGTVAIGSLILTLVQIVRMLLQSLQKSLRESGDGVAQAFMCCLKFLFDLLDSFISFISYNAYLMCAIHGGNFCQSAKNAFNLIMRNVVKIIVVDQVVDYLFLMAKLLITTLATAGIIIYKDYIATEKQEALGISILITIIGTFTISSVFFRVQTIAVKTIFLCFVEDTERNDGSEERPYFMSNKLKKLLHK